MLWLQDLLLSTFPPSPTSNGNGDGNGMPAAAAASDYDVVVAVGHGEFMHLLLKKVSGDGRGRLVWFRAGPLMSMPFV